MAIGIQHLRYIRFQLLYRNVRAKNSANIYDFVVVYRSAMIIIIIIIIIVIIITIRTIVYKCIYNISLVNLIAFQKRGLKC